MESLENQITRSIKSYYKNRLYAPIIYLVLLLIIAIVFPMKSLIFTQTYQDIDISLANMYKKGEIYGEFSLKNVYFTGYTNKALGETRGYYYYTMIGGDCVVVLLRPETCNQGEPTIAELTIKGKILHNSERTSELLDNLASDLMWTSEGIKATMSEYTISQPEATSDTTILIEYIYVVTGIFAFLSVIFYTLWILFPVLSPSIQSLRVYGRPGEILAEAEEELATLPQLATEDMFITEHYFIETSNYGVAIVPIEEIIWIYKYSNLHKLLWHHFAISYTLCITTTGRHYIRCPKSTKSNIDGIMDYLSEANHNILVGFSEENRLEVERIEGDFEFISRIRSFLGKRI